MPSGRDRGRSVDVGISLSAQGAKGIDAPGGTDPPPRTQFTPATNLDGPGARTREQPESADVRHTKGPSQ